MSINYQSYGCIDIKFGAAVDLLLWILSSTGMMSSLHSLERSSFVLEGLVCLFPTRLAYRSTALNAYLRVGGGDAHASRKASV